MDSSVAGIPSNPALYNSARDGYVPNYDVHGRQSIRTSFKDKSGYVEQEIPHHWEKPVNIRTRTELVAARRAEKHPDISFDVDGDGVVGQRDYFVGKHFDRDHDGHLNDEEKAAAVQALNDGWLDKFHWGHDQAGCKRPFPVVQRRGKILTINNGDEIGETYPSFKQGTPRHETITELRLDRKAEASNAGHRAKEKWDSRHPYYVAEAGVTQEHYVPDPPIKHISERAEADHQAARVAAGLMPINTFVNPERETKHPGLGFDENPVFPTRSYLNATRKEQMCRDAEEQRIRGELVHIPKQVKESQRETAAYAFRHPCPSKDPRAAPMTKTRLEKLRKQERVEYDAARFGVVPKEFPRFSDTSQPWWTMKKDFVHSPPTSARVNSKWMIDPPLKITDISPTASPRGPTAPQMPETRPISGRHLSGPQQEPYVPSMLDSPDVGKNRTVKRWTTQMIEAGQARNAPRLFDGLPTAATYAKDFAPLDNMSSFDYIRNQSLARQAEARVHNQHHPTASKLARGKGGMDYLSQQTISSELSTVDRHHVSGGRSVFSSQGGKKSNDKPPRAPIREDPNRIDPTMMNRVNRNGTQEAPRPASNTSRASRTPAAKDKSQTDAETRSISMPMQTGTAVRSGGFERIAQLRRVENGTIPNFPRTLSEKARTRTRSGGGSRGLYSSVSVHTVEES